jgi:hypothetical protein
LCAITVGLPPLAAVATVLFVIAAFGGVVMNLNYHWNLLPLPKWLVLVHWPIAVVGFVLVLAAPFGRPCAHSDRSAGAIEPLAPG